MFTSQPGGCLQESFWPAACQFLIFHPPVYWTLDYPSLLLGILIGLGLLLGPVLATTLGSADQSSISCPRSLTTEFLNELG